MAGKRPAVRADQLTLQAMDMEEALLGAVLANPGVLLEVLPDGTAVNEIRPGWFFIVRHQWVWGIILDLAASGIASAYLTVQQRLEEHGQPQEFDGSATLVGILNGNFYSYHAASYA